MKLNVDESKYSKERDLETARRLYIIEPHKAYPTELATPAKPPQFDTEDIDYATSRILTLFDRLLLFRSACGGTTGMQTSNQRCATPECDEWFWPITAPSELKLHSRLTATVSAADVLTEKWLQISSSIGFDVACQIITSVLTCCHSSHRLGVGGR